MNARRRKYLPRIHLDREKQGGRRNETVMVEDEVKTVEVRREWENR